MPKVWAELRPEGRKAGNDIIGEIMDSLSETTLLIVLGLACVVVLVLLPFKEDKDASGIRAGIRTRVTGSHRRGEPRRVLTQISRKRLTYSRENVEEQSQQF